MHNIINFLFKYYIFQVIFVIIIMLVVRKFLWNKMIKFLKKSNPKNAFLLVWFFGHYIAVLIYCIINWKQVIIMEPFSGNSLMFVLLLALCLIPFLTGLKLGDNSIDINNPINALDNSRDSLKVLVENAPENQDKNSIEIQEELLKNIENIENKKNVENEKLIQGGVNV